MNQLQYPFSHFKSLSLIVFLFILTFKCSKFEVIKYMYTNKNIFKILLSSDFDMYRKTSPCH